MAKKLSVSDQSRDDKESKLDVGNPNHNNATPSEITVEFEADSNVYYKETTVDSYEDNSSNHRLNSFLSRFLRVPLEVPFKTVPALQLSSLKTCNQVTIVFAEAPFIG